MRVTITQLSELLGVAASTIREWQKEVGFPDSSGGYDIEAVRAWRAARGKKGSAAAEKRAVIEALKAGEQYEQLKLKTEKDRIGLRRLEGTLLPRRTNERVWTTIFTMLREDLTQLASAAPGAAGVPQRYTAALRRHLQTEFDALTTRLKDRIDQDLAALDTELSPTV